MNLLELIEANNLAYAKLTEFCEATLVTYEYIRGDYMIIRDKTAHLGSTALSLYRYPLESREEEGNPNPEVVFTKGELIHTGRGLLVYACRPKAQCFCFQ